MKHEKVNDGKPNNRLLSNDNDIRKAIHQADLAKSLEERGVSPYARFQELNQMARNIAKTARKQTPSEPELYLTRRKLKKGRLS
jgi:hypothetical protein